MQPRLIQEQSMQWKMNQSLLQAIQILQFSNVELLNYIKEMAEENPLVDEIDTNDETFDQYRTNAAQPDIGEINPSELSMFEKLKRQLFTLDISEKMLSVVDYGIDSLDESGYLTIDLQTWSTDLELSMEIIQEALTMLQSLEPPGIGARTLQECILLQLQKMKEKVSLDDAADLLENHLEWIAGNELQAIANEYEMDEKQARNLLDHIRSCHPNPGSLLANKKVDYIIPEANIVKEAGQWKLYFYKWSKPSISINHDYEQLTGLKKEDKAYIREKKQQIEWLNNAIEYRVGTLEKIIHFVIEKQLNYFEAGAQELRPLSLKDAAMKLNISISTVSRSIHQKYVQTNQGVVPIKFFFVRSVSKVNGNAVTSAIAVKQLITAIVNAEVEEKPFSDEEIRKILASEHDVHIARRTVMKYREQLQIPASTKRK